MPCFFYPAVARFARLVVPLLAVVCTACYPGYRECPCAQPNERSQIYNQALIELVERRFYPSYLPAAPTLAFEHPVADSLSHDVVWYNQQLAIAQNRLFNDTARFRTVYLDTIPTHVCLGIMLEIPDSFWCEFLTGAGIPAERLPGALDSLQTLQHAIAPQAFQLCTFRAKPIAPCWWRDTLAVGLVHLSNLVLNPQHNLAAMTYDYHCDSRCGFSGAVVLVRVNGKWRIKRHEQLGIY